MNDLKKAAREALNLIEKIEYVIDYGLRKKYCPLCEEPEEVGHKHDCELMRIKNSLTKELPSEFSS